MTVCKNLIIVGTGGHSRVVVDIALTKGLPVRGLIDLCYSKKDECILGISVIGGMETLSLIEPEREELFIAIGDNVERHSLFDKYFSKGFRFPSLIHPTAIVSKFCDISPGVLINAGAIVNAGSVIGKGAIINTGSIIEHETVIGDFSHIAPGCTIAGRVFVGENSFVGAGSTVIDKIRLGRSSIVGAGSVVLNEIDPHCRVAGIPAKKI